MNTDSRFIYFFPRGNFRRDFTALLVVPSRVRRSPFTFRRCFGVILESL